MIQEILLIVKQGMSLNSGWKVSSSLMVGVTEKAVSDVTFSVFNNFRHFRKTKSVAQGYEF